MTVNDAGQTPVDLGKAEDAGSYLFHEEEPGVFKRRCFGIEELSGAMECVFFNRAFIEHRRHPLNLTSDDPIGRNVMASHISLSAGL